VRHFLVMILFAAMAAVIFGAMSKDTPRERWLYGFKVFGEFIVIGLVFGWILYFIPWTWPYSKLRPSSCALTI
jgi:hypothetical protein